MATESKLKQEEPARFVRAVDAVFDKVPTWSHVCPGHSWAGAFFVQNVQTTSAAVGQAFFGTLKMAARW